MAYQIISFSGSPITGQTVYGILCDTVADLPSGTISDGGYEGPVVQGCTATIIENGAKYIANTSGTWILQPSAQSQIIFPDMYDKTETDALLATKADKTEMYSLLSAKADKTDLVSLINQGQKNMFQLTGSDVTGYGIACTFDKINGTIHLDGINANKQCTGSFNIQASDSRILGLVSGETYHFSCDGYETSNDTLGLYVYTSGATPISQFDCFTNNIAAWNTAWEQASGFRLFIRQGTVVDNVTLKPMICTQKDYTISPTFEPYTPTLHELYALIKSYHP